MSSASGITSGSTAMIWTLNKTADEIIADRRREIQKLFGLSEDERGFAYEEIIRYHCRRRPHETSDLIFERTEDA